MTTGIKANNFFLQVRDGGDATAPLFGKYCAAKLTPRFLISTSHEIFITFHSDSSFASVFRLSHFIVHPDSQRRGKISHFTLPLRPVLYKASGPSLSYNGCQKCCSLSRPAIASRPPPPLQMLFTPKFSRLFWPRTIAMELSIVSTLLDGEGGFVS